MASALMSPEDFSTGGPGIVAAERLHAALTVRLHVREAIAAMPHSNPVCWVSPAQHSYSERVGELARNLADIETDVDSLIAQCRNG